MATSFVGVAPMLLLSMVLALDIAELFSPDSPPPPIFAVPLSFQSQKLAFKFYFFLLFLGY